MNIRNYEHYKDRTAHDAIKAADKPPNAVRETVENMRREANKRGFEVFGRIKLRDMKTGKIYRQQEVFELNVKQVLNDYVDACELVRETE